MSKSKPSVAHGLSIAFLDAEWIPENMARSAKRLFRSKQNWMLPLAARSCERFPQRPPLLELVKSIGADVEFRLAVKTNNLKAPTGKQISRILGKRPLVSLDWQTPRIEGYCELAQWLEVSRRELSWLANLAPDNRTPTKRPPQHYVCHLIGKRSNGSRLIESPKSKLKCIQRKIQSELLSRILPHQAAHGFRQGHSVISYVRPHVNKPFCLKMDLRDFFPSIVFGRVDGLFRTAGYSPEVARYLAAICTNSVDAEAMFCASGCPNDETRLARLYRVRHLPQGAPTSPTAANLIAYRLDARLSGLATSAGARFTRYADDILFSGGADLARSANRFVIAAGAIAIEEGFQIHFRKTRLMRASQRQSATGVVINERPNLSREEYDRLKAILFNCSVHGSSSQNLGSIANFRQHLGGRIAWVRQLNPMKAEKLQALFDRITW